MNHEQSSNDEYIFVLADISPEWVMVTSKHQFDLPFSSCKNPSARWWAILPRRDDHQSTPGTDRPMVRTRKLRALYVSKSQHWARGVILSKPGARRVAYPGVLM